MRYTQYDRQYARHVNSHIGGGAWELGGQRTNLVWELLTLLCIS